MKSVINYVFDISDLQEEKIESFYNDVIKLCIDNNYEYSTLDEARYLKKIGISLWSDYGYELCSLMNMNAFTNEIILAACIRNQYNANITATLIGGGLTFTSPMSYNWETRECSYDSDYDEDVLEEYLED